MESVASTATAVLIGYIAQGTSTIRVGAGGIMLPNHAPLIAAEQFGTLESLYPGRIDLGLGRAPGTDQATAYALRRNLHSDVEQFPNDVVEFLQYLGPHDKQGKVRAIPGVGTNVPVWMLGSSTFSAQLAAQLRITFCICVSLCADAAFPCATGLPFNVQALGFPAGAVRYGLRKCYRCRYRRGRAIPGDISLPARARTHPEQ